MSDPIGTRELEQRIIIACSYLRGAMSNRNSGERDVADEYLERVAYYAGVTIAWDEPKPEIKQP